MNRKIRIAHTISRVSSGGAEENTLFTINGLDKQRYSIDLIVSEELNQELLKNIIKDGSSITIRQVRELKGSLNLLSDPIALFKLIKIFKREKYDIVHTHAIKPGILGRIAAKYAGVPIIICGLHGSAFQAFNNKLLDWLLIYFEKLTGNFTNVYISVSDILTEKYQNERIGINAKYYTVFSGMDLNTFTDIKNRFNLKDIKKELNIDSDAFIVGNVARLEEVKGHRYLLDAFQMVKEIKKESNIVLVIVGEGKEKKHLQEYAKKLGLENCVIFTGYRKDIEKIMSIMDIFALSSLREGLPRVLVQASAAGIPSIAFNVDGVSEIINDNYNGFLIEPKDVNGLAEKIIKYIDNKELMKLHSENGKKFTKGKWTIENMVKQTD
ncbi:MAG TPA: glycosyltransferase family 4 protein, partial [Atribacterota bacterium]|nr:glycosyltransferase family 4 protein [Atribacterota bacterium]